MATEPAPGHDVTKLLEEWQQGSSEAEAALLERVHAELRRLAAGYLRHERGAITLQPTALVHEAYLRLLPQRSVRWENRSHFFGIAARMMRRVLVDQARRRRARKRDGVTSRDISLSQVAAARQGAEEVDVLELHDALKELEGLDARQASIVEQRYFAGLTIEELADVMNISTATVKREWTTAKLWLRRRLREGRRRPTSSP